jgi:predicted nucleotidyltransferase
MDYYAKYLKYRTKYLQLRNQLGGAKCEICGDDHETEDCPKRSLFGLYNSNESNASGTPPIAPVAAMVDDDNGWTTVKERPKRARVAKPPPPNISYDELIRVLKEKLGPYEKYIEGAYVYGSRARGNNKPTSDADIIIFWRGVPNIEQLKEIRAEIEQALGIETDFVSCEFTDKFVNHNDLRDQAYFDNVAVDARQFMGETYNINTLIDYSIKMPRLGRP